ncbi:MAG: hypothetical protein GVY20_09070 [Bacteroidetes bacterium]|jgi:hypothetical protein|nr:hypothetical protein [Bacteroidota bacterium]
MGKYAIFIVSALIFSMLTYSSALRNAVFLSNTRTVQTHSENQAYNIAQSAAMVAINDIRSDPSGSPFNPDPDSTYSYPSSNDFEDWVEMHGEYNVTTTNQGDTLLTVRSTGKFEESIYQVRIGLVKTTGGGFVWPPIDTAVHAEEDITLSGSGTIRGNASTNSASPGAVSMNGGAGITGNLAIGPGGNPDDIVNKPNWHGGVQGEVFALDTPYEYELPDFPDLPVLPPGSSFETEKWNDPTDFYANQYTGYYIPEISVNQNRSMNIHVGDQNRKIYVGNLDIKNGHINFVGTGKVELYVYNDINFGSGSSLNCNAQWSATPCNGETSQLMTYYGGSNEFRLAGGQYFNGNLYIESADAKFTGGSKFKGNLISGGDDLEVAGGFEGVSAFYAPNAYVQFKGGGNLRGFVVSDSYRSTGGTWVYEENLDTDLPDLDGNGGGAPTFSVTYWN